MARSTVFGLDVCSAEPLSFLAGSRAQATGRRVELLAPSPREREPRRAWRGELICDQRRADGSVNLQMERSSEHGFRIWAPGYGWGEISAGGDRAIGGCGSGGWFAWQRLLVAQILPFVAVLRGLEVLHASAVEVAAEGIGLLGRSGAGKTSLALALCRRGAGFLADDVLAIENSAGELICHPGPPVVGVAVVEARRLGELGVEAEPLAEDERERMLAMSTHEGPVPLGGLVLVEPDPGGPDGIRCERGLAANQLLASTFNLVLTDGAREQRLLDVCAQASTGLLARLYRGSGAGVEETAAAIESLAGAPA
jgi:hypothetical protein